MGQDGFIKKTIFKNFVYCFLNATPRSIYWKTLYFGNYFQK